MGRGTQILWPHNYHFTVFDCLHENTMENFFFFSYFFELSRCTNHPTHHPKLHIGRKKWPPKHHQTPNHHKQFKKQPSKHHKLFNKQPPKLQPTIKPLLSTQKTTTIKQKSRSENQEKFPQTQIENPKKK